MVIVTVKLAVVVDLVVINVEVLVAIGGVTVAVLVNLVIFLGLIVIGTVTVAVEFDLVVIVVEVLVAIWGVTVAVVVVIVEVTVESAKIRWTFPKDGYSKFNRWLFWCLNSDYH